MKMSTKKITTVSMLCAMAMIVNLLIRFPMIPSVSFLKYDPKDIVIAIGGFIYGPFICFLMSFITSILEIIFRGGTIWDVVMNIISTCTFALTAAFIYKRIHTKKGALIGLGVGTLACIFAMTIWNYIVDPIYFQMERAAIVAMLPAIGLFNLIKCGLNTAITLFLYKPVVNILRHTNLVEKSDSQASLSHDMMIVAGFILLTAIVLVLVFQGII